MSGPCFARGEFCGDVSGVEETWLCTGCGKEPIKAWALGSPVLSPSLSLAQPQPAPGRAQVLKLQLFT